VVTRSRQVFRQFDAITVGILIIIIIILTASGISPGGSGYYAK
jgi:hypothetical protein